jgi:hypothetical protein
MRSGGDERDEVEVRELARAIGVMGVRLWDQPGVVRGMVVKSCASAG